jgi:2-furoyl-CoA dehydrogenase large subunit
MPTKWIGAKVKRVEDPKFLKGKGNYIGDIVFPDMLHVAILRSPHAHALIKNIDISEVFNYPGILSIITGKDISELTDPFINPVNIPIKYYSCAIDRVRYVGEPVVAVAATDRYIAEDAIEMIKVEYEPLPAVIDGEEAMCKDAPLLHEETQSNISWHDTFEYGDINKAFAEADEIIKEKFYYHRFSSTPIETYGCVANFVNNVMTIWSNIQVPGLFHPLIAAALRLPPQRLRLIVPDIGGGFGVKAFVFPYMVLTGAIAMKTGRSVKWIEDRVEHMQAANHHPDRITYVEVAVKKDGRILGFKEKIIDVDGPYTRFPEPVNTIRPFQVLVGCYKIPSVLIDGYFVMTNKCPTGANRGHGLQHHYFVLERMMNIIGKRLGISQDEIRLKNFIQPDEFPYTTVNGSIYDSGNYPKTLEKALNIINYENLKKENEKLKKNGKYRGIGIATIVEPGAVNMSVFELLTGQPLVSGANEPAVIKIDRMGGVTLFLGCPSMGSGLLTVAVQVAAQELGLKPEDINVVTEFDSATHPWGNGTHASRFASLGTEAVAGAARVLKKKIFKIASHILECSPDDLTLEDGIVSVKGAPSRSISLLEVASIATFNTFFLPPDVEPGLEASYVYSFPKADRPDKKRRLNTATTYANSTHVALVEIDVETGKLNILRYIVVCDPGRIVNPLIVDGQVQGSVIHGIGGGIYEEFIYDEGGQPLANTFMDYLPPKAPDLPNIEVTHMETPSPFTSIGAKGIGEGGASPVQAVLANAVEDAIGFKIVDSRLSLERVKEMIKQ